MPKGRPPIERDQPLVTMSIRMPADLHQQLKDIAAKEGRSACQETVKAVEKHIESKVAEKTPAYPLDNRAPVW